MCLTINNANAFSIKDKITNIIENSDGNFLNGENLNSEIVSAIENSAYRTTRSCEAGYTGFQRDGSRVSGDGPAAVCIKCVHVSSEVDNHLKSLLGGNFKPQGSFHTFYYQVVVFYQLDLPIVKQVFNLKTKGETRLLYNDVAGLCS